MRTSSNSSGSEIGVSSKSYKEGQLGVVDLGLKLQNQDRSFPCNQRKSADDHDNDDDGGRRISGSPFNHYSMMSSNIYYVSGTSTVTGDSISYVQPLDVSYSPANPPFKPSGGGMATTAIGFPFTAAQWKELERQAMIYKYMVASLPVPPNLLYSSFPTNSTAFSPASYLLGKYGNGLNFKWVGNSKDAEPGRCRRTDGKKWRCSRDVAPNQKYCERHMHRGRPRSRKPVELVHQSNSLTDFPINNKPNSTTNSTIKSNPIKKSRLNDPNSSQNVGSPCFSTLPMSKVSCFYSPCEDSRSLAWSEEQQWQQLVQTNMNSQVFHHQFDGESLNLNAHAGLVSKSDMGLLERPLIDAWSMGVNGIKDNSVSDKAYFSSSDAIDDEMCQIHMGLGVLDQWAGSAPSPGGPLAEVLRPGSVVATTTSRSVSNPAISDPGEGDFITPTATAVSSPSGVLQKTLASFSDSSGSSSPTGHNSKAKSDMPFHWLN